MFNFDFASDYVKYPNLHSTKNTHKLTPEMVEMEQARLQYTIKNLPEYPKDKYSGKGIVMVAGGVKYLTCAYVNMCMLRETGCTLPVELWYLGQAEVDERAKSLFDGMNATFKNVEDAIVDMPLRKIGGWEMNVYAILNSSFEEVFFLDADNVPLIDLELTFEWPEYKKAGSVFWPDYGKLHKDRAIWKLLNIPHVDEREFESGQIIVDKKRCWKELMLTQYMNQHSDVYYNCVWGDKETYHMAWRVLGTEFGMIPHPIHRLPGCMSQHDFQRNIILQHRNMDKWKLEEGANRQIPGFQKEKRCFSYLQELRDKWDGVIGRSMPKTNAELLLFADLAGKSFRYHLVDKQESSGRTITLKSDGTTAGAGHVEKNWYVNEVDGKMFLIFGNNNTTVILEQYKDHWRGRWVANELFRVVLHDTSCNEEEILKSIKHNKLTYDVSSPVSAPDTAEEGPVLEGEGFTVHFKGNVPEGMLQAISRLLSAPTDIPAGWRTDTTAVLKDPSGTCKSVGIQKDGTMKVGSDIFTWEVIDSASIAVHCPEKHVLINKGLSWVSKEGLEIRI